MIKDIKSGFTLLEIIVVIIIIGVLTSLALPKMYSIIQRAKYVEAMKIIPTVVQAETAYFMMNGKYTIDIGATALVSGCFLKICHKRIYLNCLHQKKL